MSFLPEKTILGQLEIIEVYDYYDKPVLFSCKNKSGLIFIVVCVDSSDLTEIWLYAPVSSSRFQQIKHGTVELRNIFTNTEDAFVHQVEIPYEDGLNVIVNPIDCNEIPEDYLPSPGQKIESENNSDVEIEKIAGQKKKEILDLILQFPDEEIKEAPVGELGLVLYSLQEILDAIGQINLGKAESHIVQQEVKQQTQMVMSGVFSGSFGMRLEGTVYEEDNLGLGESFLGRCLKEFIQLINLGADQYELQAKLNNLKQKTALKYTEFLKALTRIGISKLHIDWASPNHPKKTGDIELETVRKVLTIIGNTRLRAEAEIRVNVKLVEINFVNRKTILQEVGSNKKYKCTITDSAINDIRTVHENSVYEAAIQDYVILSTVVGKEKHEYELLELKLSTSPEFSEVNS
jgi:hypothetical protein